jgi:hypothetical protein
MGWNEWDGLTSSGSGYDYRPPRRRACPTANLGYKGAEGGCKNVPLAFSERSFLQPEPSPSAPPICNQSLAVIPYIAAGRGLQEFGGFSRGGAGLGLAYGVE